MNRFDELLNKYLDNDLSLDELNEFNILMNKSENQVKYKSIVFIESILKKMPVDSAPSLFTEKFMSIINKPVSTKNKIDKFIFVISSLLITTIIGTIIFFMIYNQSNAAEGKLTLKFISIVKSFNIYSGLINKLIDNQVVFIIGLFSSFILLINFIFAYGSHKSLKEKIDKI